MASKLIKFSFIIITICIFVLMNPLFGYISRISYRSSYYLKLSQSFISRDKKVRKLIKKTKIETYFKKKTFGNGPKIGEYYFKGLVVERQNEKIIAEVLEPFLDENSSIIKEEKTDIVPLLQDRSLIKCSQINKLSVDHLVVGDIVKICVSKDSIQNGMITEIFPRINLLQRPSVHSNYNKLRMKNIASNIDQLIIVTSVVPNSHFSSIDRYIVSAINNRISNVMIILNKADLEGSEELYRFLDHYNNLGYPVLETSTYQNKGLDNFRNFLKDKTSIFVGQSGVGKSSLINSLIPGVNTRVSQLVKKSSIGAHTTSNSRLYHLPDGGNIIDSPGIRELGTWHLESNKIINGFKEIKEMSSQCKFNNCQHIDEAESICAVKRALNTGDISRERYNSYVFLLTQE